MANNPLNASKILFDNGDNQKAIADYQQFLKNLEGTALQVFQSLTTQTKKVTSAIKLQSKAALQAAESLKVLATQSDAYDKQIEKVHNLTVVLQALKKIEKETKKCGMCDVTYAQCKQTSLWQRDTLRSFRASSPLLTRFLTKA